MKIRINGNIDKELRRLSNRSNHSKYKHSCIIYDYVRNQIVCNGYNYTTDKNGFIHAEQMALRKFKKLPVNPENCVVIVARLSRNNYKISKPCKSCEKSIGEYPFPAVLYTTNQTKLKEMIIEI